MSGEKRGVPLTPAFNEASSIFCAGMARSSLRVWTPKDEMANWESRWERTASGSKSRGLSENAAPLSPIALLNSPLRLAMP